MPRILIFHAAVGSGHTTAANALADAFRHKQQGEVRVEDILDFWNPLFRGSLTRAYVRVRSGVASTPGRRTRPRPDKSGSSDA